MAMQKEATVVPSSADQEPSEGLAIRVTNVTKRYQSVDSGPTRNLALNDLILLMRQVFGFNSGARQFEALKDVSFSVPRGTTLGIIGGNGSGKSTLLKLISQVTPPSEGTIEIGGRIVSLLELGFGFRPDLTGRENILMSGAVYNLTKKAVRDRVDEIIEFSGIERFVDMPVRSYSSGMYLRLAFATAIHMDPDIILADEVLAVGDIRFRNRCLNKLMQLKDEGKTLLYVSHDLSEIRRLADKVLWLQDGQVKEYGDTDEVVDSYLSDVGSDALETVPAVTWDAETQGKPPAAIESAALTTSKSTPVQVIEYNRAYYMQIRVRTLEPNLRIFPRIDVSHDGQLVGRFAPLDATDVAAPSTIHATLRLPRYLFNAGRYLAKVSLEIVREDRRDVMEVEEPISFSVVTPYEAGLPHLFSEPVSSVIHPLFLTARSQWEVGRGGRTLMADDESDEKEGSDELGHSRSAQGASRDG